MIPKKAPGEFRLIHHYGDSVKTSIPPEFSTVKYATEDDAINFIKVLGQSCVLAKTDVRSAFLIIPVHPPDHPLLGFQWKDNGIMTVVLLWVALVHVKPLNV